MKIENDQFFTKLEIVNDLIYEIKSVFSNSKINLKNAKWIEPSAGIGNFVYGLKKYFENEKINIKAFDIDKKRDFIIKSNFLEDELKIKKTKQNIIIGNPPFGKRAKMAIDFVNKSFEYSDIICFILPNQFRRYLVQKNINKNLKLIHQINIKNNSFIANNKNYDVSCVFQIWVNKSRKEFKNFKDLRLHSSPQIKIDDFKTFIHNNTKETLKFFDKKKYEWDIALHRQGYYNYSEIITDEKRLIKNRQYLFIKYRDDLSKKIISKMNLDKLSKLNTTIPGYSLSDFVYHYKIQKEKEKIKYLNSFLENLSNPESLFYKIFELDKLLHYYKIQSIKEINKIFKQKEMILKSFLDSVSPDSFISQFFKGNQNSIILAKGKNIEIILERNNKFLNFDYLYDVSNDQLSYSNY